MKKGLAQLLSLLILLVAAGCKQHYTGLKVHNEFGAYKSCQIHCDDKLMSAMTSYTRCLNSSHDKWDAAKDRCKQLYPDASSENAKQCRTAAIDTFRNDTAACGTQLRNAPAEAAQCRKECESIFEKEFAE